MLAADVLAWRDSIRAAVEAERVAALCLAQTTIMSARHHERTGALDPSLSAKVGIANSSHRRSEAALDKLLSGAETVHQCPPDRSGIMPCCGRTPFEVLADRMADDPALVTCKGRAS